jgi:hypothetical protein
MAQAWLGNQKKAYALVINQKLYESLPPVSDTSFSINK